LRHAREQLLRAAPEGVHVEIAGRRDDGLAGDVVRPHVRTTSSRVKRSMFSTVPITGMPIGCSPQIARSSNSLELSCGSSSYSIASCRITSSSRCQLRFREGAVQDDVGRHLQELVAWRPSPVMK
jgi:hypothetical protein